MGERDDAKREIDQARQCMSEVVEELARRSSSQYVMRQTKEAAVRKTSEWSGRAKQSPMALGLLGGTIGASIGAALASWSARRQESQAEFYPGYAGYEREYVASTEEPGVSESGQSRSEALKERAAHGKETLKHKAQEAIGTARGRASEALGSARGKASDLRARTPSRDQLQGSATGFYHRAIDDQPLLLGVGTVLLGMIAGYLIPESQRERQAMAPVKEKVREQVRQAQDRVEQAAQSSLSSEEEAPSSASGIVPTYPDETSPLH